MPCGAQWTYKHVVLGLIFLKSISDAFEEQHEKLEAERADGADPEDPDEYRAHNIFWVPPEARWAHLKAQRSPEHHWPAHERRDGRDRVRQPRAQGRGCPRTMLVQKPTGWQPIVRYCMSIPGDQTIMPPFLRSVAEGHRSFRSRDR